MRLANIFGFLNNASVAAFWGAFVAFLLVVVNDSRRRRQSKHRIKFLVSANAEHARAQLRTVKNTMAMIREDNRVVAAQIMPFPVAALKAKQLEVVDLLSTVEHQCLSALIFWMEAIDGVHTDMVASARELKRDPDLKPAERQQLADGILSDLDDAERSLGVLIDMCNWYVTGAPHKILDMRNPIPNGNANDRRVAR